jgi:ABC-type multidrug transport system fused ATPase/permease subunit
MVAKCRAAAYDFDRLHSLDTETVEKRGVQRYPINGDISFEDVSFAYPTRPDVPVLKNLNLRIYPNESVAIVGPSGCGKSTLAALIQRLYEPTSGVIRLGDHTLATAEVTYLRNHIGVVSQTASLFDASVAENISYGAPNIGRAEIIRACKEANINGFILSLPDGYDTSLGENASLISGGQAQRLQIARALVRHAAICVLDECTSALDVENQRILLDAIQRIKEVSRRALAVAWCLVSVSHLFTRLLTLLSPDVNDHLRHALARGDAPLRTHHLPRRRPRRRGRNIRRADRQGGRVCASHGDRRVGVGVSWSKAVRAVRAVRATELRRQ